MKPPPHIPGKDSGGCSGFQVLAGLAPRASLPRFLKGSRVEGGYWQLLPHSRTAWMQQWLLKECHPA